MLELLRAKGLHSTISVVDDHDFPCAKPAPEETAILISKNRIDRKTIYAYVQKGLIPHSRIESNVRFSKHRVQRWLEERSFQPRPVNGNGAKRQ